MLLKSVSLPQLCAVHVMTLDNDSLRHFFPRLMELVLSTSEPVFDFRLSDLQERLPSWQPDEQATVRELADAVWGQSALDFVVWCDLDPITRLDSLTTAGTQAAAPFESAPKTTVLDWLSNAAIGARLQSAFFSADSDEVARQLSAAHELWTVCA